MSMGKTHLQQLLQEPDTDLTLSSSLSTSLHSVAPELPGLSLGKHQPLPSSFSLPGLTHSAAVTANCQELMRSALLLRVGNSLSCCPSKNPWEIRCF